MWRNVSKKFIILSTRVFSFILLVFILTKFIIIVNDPVLTQLESCIDDKERNEMKELIDIEFQKESCNSYFLYHILAFTLGAFVNIKRLLKLGII